ncbi:MAG: helix-turn-helix transcriptional regulator [Gammaproteobacteria bacterium]
MPRTGSLTQPAAGPLLDTGTFSRLLGNIYRAIEDPQGMRDFLAAFVGLLGAFSGSVVVVDRAGRMPRFLTSHPHFGAAVETYVARFEEDDLILAAILAAEPRRVYLLDELIDPTERATHRYFTEWGVQHDLGDVLACRVPCGSAFELMLGFLRGRSDPPFGEAEREALALLLPHMEQANDLHLGLDRLGVFADIAQEQLFHAGQGLAVLDEDGRLLFSNPTAGRLLRESGAFHSPSGVPLPRDDALSARFVALRQRCTGAPAAGKGPVAGILELPRTNAPPLLVSVLPYRPANPRGFFRDYAARVLLVISRAEAEGLDTRAQLRRMFDLSVVEADVFWRIGNGESVEEIAASYGQSIETVRTRLKRIFCKTGVRRQSDLVRLAMQGTPGWANPGAVLQ